MNLANIPLAARRNEQRKTVTLMFRSGKQVEFLIRGGVCWPVAPGFGLEARGWCVLCGKDVRDGRVYLFDESPFQCIEHVGVRDGNILHLGLTAWTNGVWARFQERLYFQGQPENEALPFIRAIAVSTTARPKPVFLDIPATGDQARVTLDTFRETDRMAMSDDSDTFKAIMSFRSRPGVKIETCPEAWAMAMALIGFELYPWRRGDKPFGAKIEPMETDE